MRNLFELSEEEKNHIRGLHESYKSKPGTSLICEQDTTLTQSGEFDVYYFGVAGDPKAEKLFHDGNKIYFFDGTSNIEIWDKESVISFRYGRDGEFSFGGEMMDKQYSLKISHNIDFKDLLPNELQPSNQDFRDRVKGVPIYYFIMFGTGNKMFLNSATVVYADRAKSKEKGLIKATKEEGYYYADYNKTYIPIKRKLKTILNAQAIVTEVGFSKNPIEEKLTPTKPTNTTTTVEEFSFTLTDPFEFDKDVLTSEGEKNLNAKLQIFDKFIKTAFDKGKLNQILDTDVVVKGFASSDGDPSSSQIGKLPACQNNKTRGEYDKCLSQKRADLIAKTLNNYLSITKITQLDGNKTTVGGEFPQSVENWANAIGVGQDSSNTGIDWKKPHKPSDTAKDRRVEFTPTLSIKN